MYNQRNIVLFVCFLVAISFVFSYSCTGDEIDWVTIKSLTTAECEISSSCSSIFGKVTAEVTDGTMTLTKCPLIGLYTYGKDIVLNKTLNLWNATTYTLTYKWSSQIIDKNCQNVENQVYCVEIKNVTDSNPVNSSIIAIKCDSCNGNKCGAGATTDFISESLSFTTSTNKTVIAFRTYGKYGVLLKIKDIELANVPCQHMCGGDEICDTYMPDSYIRGCGENTTYFQDYCDEECNVVDITSACKAPSFASTCTSDYLCDDIPPDDYLEDNTFCGSDCLHKTLDEDQEKCEEKEYTWDGVKCCGNNPNENLISCAMAEGECNETLCCVSSSACVWNGRCYNTNDYVAGEVCGAGLKCNSEYKWENVTAEVLCRSCGTWTGEDCCAGDKNYEYTAGKCINGISYSCELDGECSQKVGVTCEIKDPDCENLDISLSPINLIKKTEDIDVELNIFYFGDETAIDLTFYFIKGEEVVHTATKQISVDSDYSVHNINIEYPSSLYGGMYTLRVNAEAGEDSGEYEEEFKFIDDCLIIELPSEVEVINSTFAANIKNECEYDPTNVVWFFMDSTGLLGTLKYSEVIKIEDILLSNESISSDLILIYDQGQTLKNITLIPTDSETALNNAVNKINSVNSIYNSVNSKLGWGLFMNKETTFQLLGQTNSLVEKSNAENEKGNYILAKYYASTAESILLSIDNEININMALMLGIASIIPGALAIYIFIKNKDKLIKKPVQKKPVQVQSKQAQQKQIKK